jgi:hypothetical protein
MVTDNFFGRYASDDPMPIWWQVVSRNRFPSHRAGADFLGSIVDQSGEPLIRRGSVWCHSADPAVGRYCVVQYRKGSERYWSIYSLIDQSIMSAEKINRIFRKKVLQPLKEPL